MESAALSPRLKFRPRIRAEHKFLWFSASGCDVTANRVADIYHVLYKNSRFNNVAERARRMVMSRHICDRKAETFTKTDGVLR